MQRKKLSASVGICLILSALAFSTPELPGQPASTKPQAALDDYIKQLAARLTNSTASTSTTNLPVQSPTTNASSALIALDSLDDVHKLALGDRVSYRVVEDKEESKPLMVTDSGELEIPNLGRVAASGKTCLQLSREIKAVLEKKYYFHATVVISVDIASKTQGRIYMAGRVKLTGYQDIPTDEIFTVSKAILRAGGFGDFADQRHVKVTRKKNGASEGEVIVIDVAKILEKGQAGMDLELLPDDRVFVPSKLYNF